MVWQRQYLAEKCILISIDAYMVWCSTWSKNLGRYLLTVLIYTVDRGLKCQRFWCQTDDGTNHPQTLNAQLIFMDKHKRFTGVNTNYHIFSKRGWYPMAGLYWFSKIHTELWVHKSWFYNTIKNIFNVMKFNYPNFNNKG